MKYVGDCVGTIYPGEVKTCTVENYIWEGRTGNFLTGSAINGATTETTTQSSNVGVPQSSNVGVPNTIVQGAEDSPTLAKIAKLKEQWLDLLS